MNRNLYCYFACFLAFLFAAPIYPFDQMHNSPPLVTLEDGILEGIHFGPVQNEIAFLGVRYAAPPIGKFRWKPPQPPEHWTGARRAVQFGATCPQLPAGWLPTLPWNEDCLYLNIWTTQLDANSKRPVIVFFHGGSNTAGYSQLTPLGPAFSRQGIVVVTANYRLGPLGFLAHPALTTESAHHSSGNYGLLDQLRALKWVHENISRFGGDPGLITVMGQSSGAVDICLLMASPLATGMFQRAIMQSGDCQGTFNEDIRASIPYNLISGTGESAGERLANDLGIADSPDALQKFRAIPADEILKAWSKDRQVHFGAVVDGWVVPQQPAKIFVDGKQMRIPVLVGSNADEATVFGHDEIKTVAQYKDYLERDTGNHSAQEFEGYPAASDAVVPARILQLENDSFAYGAFSMAQAMTRASEKSYLYCFTFVASGKRAPLGAYHGEELNFLSDAFPRDWEYSADDQRLGRIMRTYWTQFAKKGDPNAPDVPEWPAYNGRANQYFELGLNTAPRPIPSRLVLFEGIMNQIFSETLGPLATHAIRVRFERDFAQAQNF